ncbi:hypothetical protein K4K95_16120 [Phaeobacter inhibens]|uniref:hypothetical protein n=1 Tax=Phaeobacter inhibens TaxID=221822 RepID=UPI0021A2EEBD|nr:hypothetical protein [Phaeobacter inhibens]UWR68228.1 hypothetical protein K4K95_16120 [Phaeobacter inhibens]
MEGSRYLDLAERIISVRGVPLTGTQIIDFAEEYNALPFDSYNTIVKTLQARIAEDIAKHRNKSRFVRMGIGVYFLRRLAGEDGRIGFKPWLKPYYARKKPEHPHRILTVPRELVSNQYESSGWPSVYEVLKKGKYDYQSEIESDYLPVVTGVTLRWRSQYLLFRVGVHTHFRSLIGCHSILLRKYVDEFDLDLFETDGTGVTSSTARAALPVLAPGRRSRLENGRLRESERVRFYQVADLLKNKMVRFSHDTGSLTLISTIDLNTVYAQLPKTQRRLENNNANWIAVQKLASVELEADSSWNVRRITEVVS